jgi:hypothetical protein
MIVNVRNTNYNKVAFCSKIADLSLSLFLESFLRPVEATFFVDFLATNESCCKNAKNPVMRFCLRESCFFIALF